MSNAETSNTQECENPVDTRELSRQWRDIDREKAERQVKHLQSRISKAYKEGKTNLAKRLQHLLTNSHCAEALAVRRVSQKNKGKNTPDVDGTL